ncbi:MAG: radical SAM family heme chaperone HemW [Chloroflexota bacterium]|nr:radical SAM family heme chaperone HemW [Chloroflexota bacterium]
MPTAVYIHIPFCRTKCSYCDFNTYAGIEPLIPRYLEALCKEARRYPTALPVHTLNFGGGTPSLLSPSQLNMVIETCRRHFAVAEDAEISIEANPDGLDQAYFAALRDIGVNRVSFGVQSFHAAELRMLLRRHDAPTARSAFQAARAAGICNLSLDFMYGLPGQPLDGWRRTLEQALALRPEHLSLYALTLHQELPLARQVRRGELPAPDEDLAADMYELAESLLAGEGYRQYEISNWSLGDGHRCRHNLAYWRNTGYIGLGAGAHSYFARRRYVNELLPLAYVDKIFSGGDAAVESEPIDDTLARAETAILGLRLNEGVALTEEELARLDDCVQAGLVELSGRHATLTAKGRLLSNEVFWRLLPERTTTTCQPAP